MNQAVAKYTHFIGNLFNRTTVIIWTCALLLGILCVVMRSHVRNVSALYDASYRLRIITRALVEPIWNRSEFPQIACRDKDDNFTISWRADIVNDFAPGKPITYNKLHGVFSESNRELAQYRHRWFCDDSERHSMKTSIFAIANGKSLFEIGNEWRSEKQIPSDAIVAVFLSFVTLDHWAQPGDICIGSARDDYCVTTFEAMDFPAGGIAVCVFWDEVTWVFYRKEDLQIALQFADLYFADEHNRDEVLKGIGRKIYSRAR